MFTTGYPLKYGQILTTATQFFMEKGYAATSMDDIAAATPVSKATLYKYFKDKNDLFAAVIRDRCQLLCDKIHQTFSQEQHLATGLQQIAETFWQLIHSPEAISAHVLVISEHRAFPEIGQIFYESGPQQIILLLSNYLAKAGDKFGLKIEDPYQAAVAFLGLLKGEMHIKTLLGLTYECSETTRNQLITQSIQLFLKGYAK